VNTPRTAVVSRSSSKAQGRWDDYSFGVTPGRRPQSCPPGDKILFEDGLNDTQSCNFNLGRRLRLARDRWSPGSFIGAMHRQAARLDDRYELVAGVLSSNSERAKKAGMEIGLVPERAYASVSEMLETEASRNDGADVVAIMTPNDSHYEFSIAALERGLDVICDKPMTNTLQEAQKLHKKVQDSGLVFCLTHNYTGYPMVRQAKAMVMEGEVGTIRLVQVEYVQGGKADENDPDPSKGELPWRYDPVKGGPSLVMGDIGTHAHNLARFITRARSY